MSSGAFERLAGTLATVVGIGGLAYSVSFVIVLRSAPTSAALLAGFVANPAWYLWLGRDLRRVRAPADATLVPPPRS